MDREPNYISLQDATKFCGYTQEYLSLRARQGKLKAVKFGRNWVTKEEWLKEYLGQVETYNNHNHLGRVPENLPIETSEETVVKIKLNQSPSLFGKIFPAALRPIFSLGLVFILLAANIALGKEDLFQAFKTADHYVAKIGETGKTIIAQGKEGAGIVFSDIIKETRNKIPKIEIAKNVIQELVAGVFRGISFFVYMAGENGDKIINESGESIANVGSDVAAIISDLDFGVAEIGEGAGGNLKDYFSWLKQNYFAANDFAEGKIRNSVSSMRNRVSNLVSGIKNNYLVANDFIEQKIMVAETGVRNSVSFVGNRVSNLVSGIKNNYLAADDFIENGARNLVSNIRNRVSEIGNRVSNIGKFVSAPWKISPEKIAEKEKSEPAKEIVKEVEVSKITRVEPVREITKEIFKIDDKALAQVRAQLVDMEIAIGNRLYAPGGVITQQIYIKEPVASPKIYQENGDIVLQALGTGNVVLTAGTGIQISGSQVVIDSTSVSNPLVYIADRARIAGNTEINGTLTAGPITSQTITLNAPSDYTGKILDLQVNGTTKLSVDETGALTFGGSGLTASSTLTVYGTTTLATLQGSVGIGTTTPVTLFAVGTTTNIFNVTMAGRVGIGTTTPRSKLHIITGGDGAVRIEDDTTASIFLLATYPSTGRMWDLQSLGWNGNFRIYDEGIKGAGGGAGEVLTIKGGSGNVGIATTTPRDTLEVWGGAYFGTSTRPTLYVASSTGRVGIGTSTPNTLFTVGTTTNIFNVTYSGVGIATSSPTGLFTVGRTSPAFVITSTGNVGIATTTPRDTLEVWGGAYFGTSTKPTLYVASSTGRVGIGTSTPATLFTVGTTTNIFNVTYSGVGIATSSPTGLFTVGSTSPAFVITSAGRIGIGTASPSGKLNVGSDNLIVTTDGNIGIATTTPRDTLEVWGGAYFGTSTIPTLYVASTTGRVAVGTSTPDTLFTVGTTTNIFNVTYSGVGIATSSPTGLFTVGRTSPNFVITSAGNIGIATTTPRDTLEVWGGAYFGTSTIPTLYVASTTGRVGIGTSTPDTLFTVGTTTNIFNVTNYGVGIATSSPTGLFTVGSTSPAFVITSEGRIGIGTTTPASTFGVWGTSSFLGGNVGIGTTTPVSTLDVFASSTTAAALTVYQNATGTIVDFRYGVSTSTFTLQSEDRLKLRDGLVQTWGDFNSVVLDDFEDGSVSDWISYDTNNTKVNATTTQIKVNDYSLVITTVVGSSASDTATTSPGTTDWQTYERLGFWLRADYNSTSSAATTSAILNFRFYDSGGTTTDATSTIREFGKWQYEEVNLGSVTDTDKNAVSWYGFRIENDYGSPTFYIDQLRLYDSGERTSEIFVDSSGSLNLLSPTRIDLTRSSPGQGSRPGISVDTAVVEINQPLVVNTGGDVGFDYDLVFNNTGLSSITSEGPLTISAGDPNHYENLTLKTGGTGDLIMDIASSTVGFKIMGSATSTFGNYVFRVAPAGQVEIGGGLIIAGGSLIPSTTTATTTTATTSAYSLGTSTAVWSNIWVYTSHVGDIIFANNFTLTEAVSTSSPQSLIFQNASGTSIMVIDENGQLTVDTVKTRQLCVGSVCVTEAEFQAMFSASISTPAETPPPEETPPAEEPPATTTEEIATTTEEIAPVIEEQPATTTEETASSTETIIP